MTMLALSIHQPYAELIRLGVKTWETGRSWPMPASVIGERIAPCPSVWCGARPSSPSACRWSKASDARCAPVKGRQRLWRLPADVVVIDRNQEAS